MVSQVLTNESASLRTNVALLLLSYHDFDSFTNNKWRGSNQPGTFGSLEDVHNEIHDRVGGSNGHMAALETSSFDPIFWLHHWQVPSILFGPAFEEGTDSKTLATSTACGPSGRILTQTATSRRSRRP